MIILLDISTINSTDFFDKILRGQMGEGGEGKRNLEDWKMMLSTIRCVCCGAICCVWSVAYCVIYCVVVDTVYHCIVLYRIAVHLYYCATV